MYDFSDTTQEEQTHFDYTIIFFKMKNILLALLETTLLQSPRKPSVFYDVSNASSVNRAKTDHCHVFTHAKLK